MTYKFDLISYVLCIVRDGTAASEIHGDIDRETQIFQSQDVLTSTPFKGVTVGILGSKALLTSLPIVIIHLYSPNNGRRLNKKKRKIPQQRRYEGTYISNAKVETNVRQQNFNN